jgi:predicted XRE-type DNA-binding protein
MTEKRYDSVWDAVADTSDEAENMRIRSVLIMYLEGEIARRGWSQAEAAAHLGVTQPRVSDLLRGKISLFGLDSLVNMVAAMGAHIDVKVRTSKRTSRHKKEHAAA